MTMEETRTEQRAGVELDHSEVLTLEDVTKQFGNLTAIDGVNLAVEDGEFLGLIGPNGAGKTTLFNVISGFIPPDSGRIQLLDHNITTTSPSRIARTGLSRTFQHVKPFSEMTGLENVMVGSFMRTASRAEASDAARDILERFDLDHVADRTPEQYTLAEKKRLDLARAMAIDPRVVLVDEIFAGLNPDEQHSMMETLDRIHREGTTVILIEHVMGVIMELSERIVVLNDGSVIADNSPEKIATDENVISAYLGEGWEESDA